LSHAAVFVAAPPSAVKEVFSIEVEQRPVHVEADYCLKLNVQPVEIVYDEVILFPMIY
jgi:hypothetical protein